MNLIKRRLSCPVTQLLAIRAVLPTAKSDKKIDIGSSETVSSKNFPPNNIQVFQRFRLSKTYFQKLWSISLDASETQSLSL